MKRLIALFLLLLPSFAVADTTIVPFTANVRRYGAMGDGVTDDSAAFRASFAASPSVYVPPGVYRICGIDMPSNSEIFGNGPASILKSSCTYRSDTNLLNILGSLGSYTTLTADTTKGSRSVTVSDSSALSVGQFIFLTQGSTWAEGHLITEVSGQSVTFNEGIQYEFLNGDKVQTGTWISNVSIHDLTFQGTPSTSKRTTQRHEDHGVSVQYARNIVTKGNRFFDLNSRAIIYINHVANSIADGNIVERALDRGIESHTRTSNNILTNNVITGGAVGLSCQGIGTVCTGNRSFGQHGFDANEAEHGQGLYLASAFNVLVSGNSIGSSFDDCMPVANAYRSIVTNNMLSGCRQHGIAISSSNHLLIANNSISEWGSASNDAAIHFWGSTSHVTIDGNRIAFKPTDGVARRALSDEGVGQSYITLGLNSMYGSEFKEINLTAQAESLQTERLAVGSPLTIADGDSYRYTGADWVPGRMEVWGLAKAKGQLFTQTAAPSLLNGECTMSLTSDTNVKVTCKGSDATIRNADITIAP